MFTDYTAGTVTALLGVTRNDKATNTQLLEVMTAIPWEAPHLQSLAQNLFGVQLAERRMDKGQSGGVADLLTKVTDPEALTAIAADRRYQAFWPELEKQGRFDWKAQAGRHVDLMTLRAAADPESPEAAMDLINALRAAGRQGEAVAVGASWLPMITAYRPGESPDRDEAGAWLLNAYGGALTGAGRLDDAKAVYERASTGEDKVSFNINFGEILANRGRDAEALDYFSRVKADDASTYGLMWAQAGRACLARTSDPALAESLLKQLRRTGATNTSALTKALLCLNLGDEAADLFIKRLKTPEDRSAALHVAAIGPHREPYSPLDAELAARLETLLATPKVAAAINKAGRRLTLPEGLAPLFDF